MIFLAFAVLPMIIAWTTHLLQGKNTKSNTFQRIALPKLMQKVVIAGDVIVMKDIAKQILPTSGIVYQQ